MATRVTHTRISRAGSLLVLLSVMLLAAVGVIYVAQPAEATGGGCTEIDDGVNGSYTNNGATTTITWTNPHDGEYYGFSWTTPTPAGAKVAFSIDLDDEYFDEYVSATSSSGSWSHSTSDHHYIRDICLTGTPAPPAQGTIVIDKVTVPTTGDDPNFGFRASWDPGSGVDFWLDDNDTPVPFNLNAGTYSVYESDIPSDWVLTSATCSDGSPVSAISLQANETVTCTFTNTYNKGTIVIDKVTIPDTEHFPDFGFEASWDFGGGVDFWLDDNDTPKSFNLNVGTYSVSESSVPAGWSLLSATCSDGSPVTAINLAAGETVTCTFTNEYLPPEATLTVVKHVVTDDGGTAVAGNWTMDVTAVNPSDPSFPGAEAGTTITVDPGAFSVGESGGPAGYSLLSAVGCEGTAVAGEHYTCTITNDDDPATLTVVKDLVNNNGGSLACEDFSFGVSGGVGDDLLPRGSAPTAFEPDCSNTVVLDAGTYNVAEPPVGGYATSYRGCSGIVLANGGSATCTITNNDIPPSLTLRKLVVNDSGGFLAEVAWTLSATGPTSFFGTTPAVSGALFSAGTYALSESGPGGYSQSAWACVGDGVQVGSEITLGLGDEAVCTITNDDIFNPGVGHIVVVKQVEGAGAPAASFAFSASWGAFPLAAGGSADSGELLEGFHSVAEVLTAEQLAAGWSLTGASCSDGSAISTIALSAGETVTCTFVNTYSEVAGPAGSLTIIKVTDPAGGTGFGFTPSANLAGGSFSLNDGGSQTFADLAAGSYSVTENLPEGWSLRDDNPIVCETAAGAALDVVYGAAGVTVNLAEDQVVTCTFFNESDEQVAGPEGSLTIIKATVPAGGTGFGFTTSENLSGPFTLDDGGSMAFTELEAGTYTVTETPSADWEFAQVECEAVDYVVEGSSVTVNLTDGEVAVCTFTNGELPYTGTSDLTAPLLLAGLWAILMGLAVAVWSLMREADKA